MQPQTSVFINSSLIGSTTVSMSWVGGRTTMAFAASQFGTSVQPQLNVYDRWVPVCSAIVSSQMFTFDAPPGQYRIAQAGSSIGLVATMSIVPT